MKMTEFQKANEQYIRRVGAIVFFQKGPLSQWWGGFPGQTSDISITQSDTSPHSLEQCFLNQRKEFTRTFTSCEQYMMAMKAQLFGDQKVLEKILATNHPAEIKKLGREVKNFDEALWNLWKTKIVYRANKLKFSQNSDLRDYFLSFSPNTIFAEAAPWDRVWGIGMGLYDDGVEHVSSWTGKNLLGLVLTQLRINLELSNATS